MNVLQILPELNAGGVERTTIEVSEALIAEGHEAHIASKGGRMETELLRMGATLHPLNIGSKNPLTLNARTRALIEIIQKNTIEIVHARSRAPAWPAFWAAQKTNVPFVTTYHGIYNAKSALKRRYNSVMARGDIIIANSHYTKAHIVKEHGTDETRITVIARAVDMDVFDPAKIDPARVQSFRDKWALDSRQKAILLPGRLTRWKGQLVAIEALAKLPSHCVLILLGDPQGRDKYVAELKESAIKHGVADRVKIAKHTRDVPAALLASDVVLSASTDPEAFGRISAEAQAVGRPVVATAHGGSLETVLDGVTGFHIIPGDADDMARGLAQALDWPDYAASSARFRIGERFSKKRLQADTLTTYKRVFDLTT